MFAFAKEADTKIRSRFPGILSIFIVKVSIRRKAYIYCCKQCIKAHFKYYRELARL